MSVITVDSTGGNNGHQAAMETESCILQQCVRMCMQCIVGGWMIGWVDDWVDG
jgi:hypothetical protein